MNLLSFQILLHLYLLILVQDTITIKIVFGEHSFDLSISMTKSVKKVNINNYIRGEKRDR